ncbi:DEAH-box ATP-dependent RNA helicase prp22 [Thoreauomyces humboldtii]|nr:DEAH-box ATP-dependent RNA helicase prp22 [Thoreauomyces humboldtii]
MTASLEKLEYLSLVSKITSELLNHTGIDDKVLAEFIISLHAKSKDVESFKRKLDLAIIMSLLQHMFGNVDEKGKLEANSQQV